MQRFVSLFYKYLLRCSLILTTSLTVAQGGGTTIKASNQHAFSQPAANMPISQKLDFSVGNSFFRNPWVIAPSTTTARDGLGPLYNTNACQNCHLKDGRGHPPEPGSLNAVSLLVRLSVPAKTAKEKTQLVQQGVIPEPNYGTQLQDFTLPGVPAEGQIQLSYTEQTITLHDNETVSLRNPILTIKQLNYGELAEDVMTSARIAPAMIGLGLLAAIADSTLLAHADPEDNNQDGISGRVNRVWDIEQAKTVIGRFGWKAGQATLKQQNAAAFHGDLGITSSLFPQQNCRAVQTQCLQSSHGGNPELSDNILQYVTFYSHNLAVPARRNAADPEVIRGEKLFQQANCHRCHLPQLTTGESDFHWLSRQTIAPFSDLLLHDMGAGLADQRPEFIASGREWRTAPLWGIGLTETVVGKAYFLHDGRARNLLEAILWHGGEAESSKQQVIKMSKAERDNLIQFLLSL